MKTRLVAWRALAAATLIAAAIPSIASAQNAVRLGSGSGAIEIDATSITFSMSRSQRYDPMTGETLQPVEYVLSGGPFYVSRFADESTPSLIGALASGKPFSEVDITLELGGDEPTEMKWTLADAVINNYSNYVDGDSRLIESFDISFRVAFTTGADGKRVTIENTSVYGLD